MKTATYTGMDNKPFTVDYDETAPCRICGRPVMEASMGGTDICPWCDCGKERPDKDVIKAYELQDDNIDGSPKD